MDDFLHFNKKYQKKSTFKKDDLNSFLKQIIKTYDIEISDNVCEQKLKNVTRYYFKKFSKSQVREILVTVLIRSDLRNLFDFYSSNGEYLNSDELRKFLQTEQDEIFPDSNHFKQILDYYSSSQPFASQVLSYENFVNLIENHCIIHKPPVFVSPTNLSLASYYCSSSHNTFMKKEQISLTGVKTEAIEIALKEGCKCIELDTWDRDDGPVVSHQIHDKITLSNSKPLKPILETINDFCFHHNDYPLVISLQNGCNDTNMDRMAVLFESVLGKKLIKEGSYDITQLATPTLEQLRGKIIIKAHLPNNQNRLYNLLRYKCHYTLLSKSLPNNLLHHDFKHFNIASISETSFAKKFENIAAFREFTTKNLVRTYPQAANVLSGNYSPVKPWSTGCQFVSLNTQTGGINMTLNREMFRSSLPIGYRLKPPCVLNSCQCRLSRWSVQLISGFSLNNKNDVLGFDKLSDPYTKISVYNGVEENIEFETHHIDNNGWNPVWNSKELQFVMTCQFTGFIAFKVKDKDTTNDQTLGLAAVRFSDIKTGFRIIELESKKGKPVQSEKYKSTLLVKFRRLI